MADGLTAAVAGAGFIGPVHAEALRRLGIRVAGVLGRDADESEAARRAMILPRAYNSFEELLADESVDAVHLAVPNVLHYPMAKRALEAGKHVMCEKPLAMNAEESAGLVETARAAGRCAGVCYNVRFYPMNLEARLMARRGDIGDIRLICGSYVQDWLLYDTDYNWRVLAEQGGALRAVADIGTHWLDLVQSVTGLEVESVFAELHTVHPVRKRPRGEVQTFTGGAPAPEDLEPVNIATEDFGCVLLRFKGGARGSLRVSQVTAGRKNQIRYEISGSEATLAWNGETPNELWVGRRGAPSQALTRDPSAMGEAARPFSNYPAGHNEGFPDTFKQCFRAFYQAIADGGKTGAIPYPTFEDGHKEVALCEAILASYRGQRWTDV